MWSAYLAKENDSKGFKALDKELLQYAKVLDKVFDIAAVDKVLDEANSS